MENITIEQIEKLIDTKLESIINDIEVIKNDIVIINDDLRLIDRTLSRMEIYG